MGKNGVAYYQTKDGEYGVYIPRSNEYNQSDSINSLFTNRKLHRGIENIEKNHSDLFNRKFTSFKKP